METEQELLRGFRYGDIISLLISEKNRNYNKPFFVEYIGTEYLVLRNIYDVSGAVPDINPSPDDGENEKMILYITHLTTTSPLDSQPAITSISLLYRSEKNGFIEQNNLQERDWIQIFFDPQSSIYDGAGAIDIEKIIQEGMSEGKGFLMVASNEIQGKSKERKVQGTIVKIEEDQLQIQTITNDILTIDFAYRGLSPQWKIKRMIVCKPTKEDASIVWMKSQEQTEANEDDKYIQTVDNTDEEYLLAQQSLPVPSSHEEEIQIDDSSLEIEEYSGWYQMNDIIQDVYEYFIAQIPRYERTKIFFQSLEKYTDRLLELKMGGAGVGTGTGTGTGVGAAKTLPAWMIPVVDAVNVVYDIVTNKDEEDESLIELLKEVQIQNTKMNKTTDKKTRILTFMQSFQKNDNTAAAAMAAAALQHVLLYNSQDKLHPFHMQVLSSKYEKGEKKYDKYKIEEKPNQIRRLYAPTDIHSWIVCPHLIHTLPTFHSTMSDKIHNDPTWIYFPDMYPMKEHHEPYPKKIFFPKTKKHVFHHFLPPKPTTTTDETLPPSPPPPPQKTSDDGILPTISEYLDYMTPHHPLSIQKQIDVLESLSNRHVHIEDYHKLNAKIKLWINDYKKVLQDRKGYCRSILAAQPPLRKNAEPKTIENTLFLLKYQEYIQSALKHYALPTYTQQHLGSQLSYIHKLDQSQLLTVLMRKMLLSLIIPENSMDWILEDMSRIENIRASDSKCTRRFLAKKYYSEESMRRDDKKDIFYDKEFDDTPYSILNMYKQERRDMKPAVFAEFLEDVLVRRHACPTDMAKELSAIILLGRKPVQDGEYAILEEKIPMMGKKTEDTKIIPETFLKKRTYFIRENKIWIKPKEEDKITPHSFEDNNTLFCNLSENTCIKNNSKEMGLGQCLDISIEKLRLEQNIKSRSLEELNFRYDKWMDNLKATLEKQIVKCIERLQILLSQQDSQLWKANQFMLSYANTMSLQVKPETIVVSPYITLRNLVLSNALSFTERQYYIIQFVHCVTRNAIAEKEDPDWRYCKDTNAALLPTFLYTLALAYQEGGVDEYNKKLEWICNVNGAISEDHQSIVDKKSGYIIRAIDFSTEEGYDTQGFKISTRDVLNNNNGLMTEEAESPNEDEVFGGASDEYDEEIDDIIKCLYGVLHLEPTKEILKMARKLGNRIIRKKIPSEKEYEKKHKKDEKTYVEFKQEYILLYMALLVLYIFQTNTPPIVYHSAKDKKDVVFFETVNDSETKTQIVALSYILTDCIGRSSHLRLPLNRKSIEHFFLNKNWDRIRSFIENEEVIVKRRNKKKEMETRPRVVAINAAEWVHFQPPLATQEMSNITQLPANFIEENIQHIVKGKKEQWDDFAVIRGKIQKMVFAIVQHLNEYVSQKPFLLQTSQKVLYMQNACCNDHRHLSAPNPETSSPSSFERIVGYKNFSWDYFSSEIKSIEVYRLNILKMAIHLQKVKEISQSPMFFSISNMRMNHMYIPNTMVSNEIIYAAFIHYCHLDKPMLPIPKELHRFISQKPSEWGIHWPLQQKIKSLIENEKKIFHETQLFELIKIVRQKNLRKSVEMTAFAIAPATSSVLLMELFPQFLERKKAPNKSAAANMSFSDFLQSENEELSKCMRSIFIRKTKGKKAEKKDFILSKFHIWDDWQYSESNGLHGGEFMKIHFLKNFIHHIATIYPHRICCGTDENRTISKSYQEHWNFSRSHIEELNKRVENYNSTLEVFSERIQNDRMGSSSTSGNFDNRLRQIYENNANIQRIYKILAVLSTSREMGETATIDNDTMGHLFVYCILTVFNEYCITTAEKKTNTDDDVEMEEIDISVNNNIKELLNAYLYIFTTTKIHVNESYMSIQEKTSNNQRFEKDQLLEIFDNLPPEERMIFKALLKYRIDKLNVINKNMFKYDKVQFDNDLDLSIKMELERTKLSEAMEEEGQEEQEEQDGMDVIEEDDYSYDAGEEPDYFDDNGFEENE